MRKSLIAKKVLSKAYIKEQLQWVNDQIEDEYGQCVFETVKAERTEFSREQNKEGSWRELSG